MEIVMRFYKLFFFSLFQTEFLAKIEQLESILTV